MPPKRSVFILLPFLFFLILSLLNLKKGDSYLVGLPSVDVTHMFTRVSDC